MAELKCRGVSLLSFVLLPGRAPFDTSNLTMSVKKAWIIKGSADNGAITNDEMNLTCPSVR